MTVNWMFEMRHIWSFKMKKKEPKTGGLNGSTQLVSGNTRDPGNRQRGGGDYSANSKMGEVLL